MLTFTCLTCGTVTTVGKEKKPYRPEMETKDTNLVWECDNCGTLNRPRRLTCERCHKGR